MTQERCDKSERLSRDLDIIRLQACDRAKVEAEQVLRREVKIRAYFNSLNGGTNVPPLSGFVPPLKCVAPPILCGGLSLNL